MGTDKPVDFSFVGLINKTNTGSVKERASTILSGPVASLSEEINRM